MRHLLFKNELSNNNGLHPQTWKKIAKSRFEFAWREMSGRSISRASGIQAYAEVVIRALQAKAQIQGKPCSAQFRGVIHAKVTDIRKDSGISKDVYYTPIQKKDPAHSDLLFLDNLGEVTDLPMSEIERLNDLFQIAINDSPELNFLELQCKAEAENTLSPLNEAGSVNHN